MSTFTVAHGGGIGDVILAIPSIQAILEQRGLTKCTLLLKPDQPARWVPNLIHPSGSVKMKRKFCESLIPLLASQPYFEEVAIWNGEPVDLDLDGFRASGFPFDRGDIAFYYSHVWPCQPKLWEPWLHVEAESNNLILVNQTQRYHHPKLSYSFLGKIPGVQFVGLAEEYRAFRKKHLAVIPYLITKNFLDLAKAIKGCKLFIGNQSSAWTIAEGLKVKRLLEVFPGAPNNHPHGPNGWQVWKQANFEKLVEENR